MSRVGRKFVGLPSVLRNDILSTMSERGTAISDSVTEKDTFPSAVNRLKLQMKAGMIR